MTKLPDPRELQRRHNQEKREAQVRQEQEENAKRAQQAAADKATAEAEKRRIDQEIRAKLGRFIELAIKNDCDSVAVAMDSSPSGGSRAEDTIFELIGKDASSDPRYALLNLSVGPGPICDDKSMGVRIYIPTDIVDTQNAMVSPRQGWARIVTWNGKLVNNYRSAYGLPPLPMVGSEG